MSLATLSSGRIPAWLSESVSLNLVVAHRDSHDPVREGRSRSIAHAALSDSGNNRVVSGELLEPRKRTSAVWDALSEAGVNPYCDIVGMIVRVFKDIERHGTVLSTGFNEGRMCPIHKKEKKERSLEERTETLTLVDEYRGRER